MVFCKNCKYLPTEEYSGLINWDTVLCRRFYTLHLVSGNEIPTISCKEAREEHGICGPEGNYYVSKLED